MKKYYPILICVIVLQLSLAAQDNTSSYYDKILGDWQVEKFQYDDVVMSGEEIGGMSYHFKTNDVVILKTKDGDITGTWDLETWQTMKIVYPDGKVENYKVFWLAYGRIRLDLMDDETVLKVWLKP